MEDCDAIETPLAGQVDAPLDVADVPVAELSPRWQPPKQ
jgi:hypothetical protein